MRWDRVAVGLAGIAAAGFGLHLLLFPLMGWSVLTLNVLMGYVGGQLLHEWARD